MSIMVGVGHGRAGRRADQERRGAGAHGEGRHARGRQDRHADRGQAVGDRRSSPARGLCRGRGAAARRPSVERASEHPLAPAIVAAAEERGIAAPPSPRISTPPPARARSARSRASAIALGNASVPRGARRRRRRRSPTRPTRCAATARRRSSSASTARSPAGHRHRRSGQADDARGAGGAARRRASASSC